MGEHSFEHCYGLEAPFFAGHFPGNPVVPAVVILQTVVDSVVKLQPGLRLRSVANAKFTDAVRPGQMLLFDIVKNDNRLSFSCHRGEQLVATGELILSGGDEG